MQNTSRGRKSPIVIGENDHARLASLADAIATRSEELADTLASELDRARVVPDRRVPANVIRIGSTAVWRTENGEERRGTLVLPAEADISSGKVSVLTPVGIALLGLSPGQTMEWTARDGRLHALTVLTVEAPAVEDAR